MQGNELDVFLLCDMILCLFLAAKPMSSASGLPPGGVPSMPPMGNKYTKPKGRGMCFNQNAS